ncbi:hypothetical protein ABIE51_003533 [Lysobacter sp. OAE881]
MPARITHSESRSKSDRWIPAYAGMTASKRRAFAGMAAYHATRPRRNRGVKATVLSTPEPAQPRCV